MPSREMLLKQLRGLGSIQAVANLHRVTRETVAAWMNQHGVKRKGFGEFE